MDSTPSAPGPDSLGSSTPEDALGAAHFTPHIGEVYDVQPQREGPIVASITLIEVESPSQIRPDGRPFSLVFEGAEGPTLEQGTYGISRRGTPAESIFLVPIDSGRYEAVFN